MENKLKNGFLSIIMQIKKLKVNISIEKKLENGFFGIKMKPFKYDECEY